MKIYLVERKSPITQASFPEKAFSKVEKAEAYVKERIATVAINAELLQIFEYELE